MKKSKPITNYHLPAEFEQHQSTWIAWPHNKNDWPGKFSPINWVYTEIAKHLSYSEKLDIIVKDSIQKKSVLHSLNKCHTDLTNISFHIIDSDRSWLRDTFPQFVVDTKTKKLTLMKFIFNGWAKYSNFKKDEQVPKKIGKILNRKLVDVKYKNRNIVLEGGSIDYNGKGVLLTTRECLLDETIQTRNPGIEKEDYEKIFHQYLGIEQVIWLDKGIAGDDTHGHIDDICRFVNEDTVVLVQEKNKKDPNYYALQENKEILQEIYLNKFSKLNVEYLPMPKAITFDNMRLPASYANFYIANKIVLVPTFNDENDRIALNILSDLFPKRKVIGINSTDLIWGLGTLHCLTHEQPVE